MSMATPAQIRKRQRALYLKAMQEPAPAVLPPVRQGVARRHPGPRLRAQPCEWRSAGRGRRTLRAHRSVWGRPLARRIAGEGSNRGRGKLFLTMAEREELARLWKEITDRSVGAQKP